MRAVRRLLPALVALLVVACGGGDSATGPTAPVPTSIGLSTTSASLAGIGQTTSVTAVVRDAEGQPIANAPVTWSVQDASIVAVSGGATATITSRERGGTVLTASSGSVSAQLTVLVRGATGVQLIGGDAAIRIGTNTTLQAIVGADPGVSTQVTWQSDATSVATVNAQGVVTGVSPGTARITAAAVADPRQTATTTITVTPARAVIVSPAAMTVGKSETRALTATVLVDPGEPTGVTWRSNRPLVATVDANGRVTGVTDGEATITAVSLADTTLRASSAVRIIPVIRTITLSPASDTLFIGQSRTFTRSITADQAADTTMVWESDAPTVASVDAGGRVTAISHGTARIRTRSVADTTRFGEATLVVAPRPVALTLAPRSLGLVLGQSRTVSATVTGDPGIATTVQWTARNSAVATVSATGTVTAVGIGQTTLVATATADATKRDSVSVIVTPQLAAAWSTTRLGGPLIEDLVSLASPSYQTALAVNSEGDVFRWSAGAWLREVKGSDQGTRFRAVHGVNTHALAVGDDGVVMRWDGSTWTRVDAGSTADFTDVWTTGPEHAWLVAADGSIRRFANGVWSATTSGTTNRLRGVWGNATLAWAVGDGGVVRRWNGTTWEAVTSGTTRTLHDVWARDSVGSALTVVGDFGTILRSGSGALAPEASGTSAPLYAVSGNAGNAIAIAGDGVMLERGGSGGAGWTQRTPPYRTRFGAVVVDVGSEVWLGGQRGLVMRRTGETWSTLSLTPDLLDVWSTSATHALAVGELGFIWVWNGTTWTRQEAPTLQRLNTVWAASADVAFAGGDGGELLRWTGSAWERESSPTSSPVYAMWGRTAGDVWAVTDAGEILRRDDSGWRLAHDVEQPLYGIYGTPDGTLYAVGLNGVALRRTGSTWTDVTGSPPNILVGVWGADSTSALVVGARTFTDGVAQRWELGASWQSLSTATTRVLTAVWGPHSADVYAVGDAGTIIRWDGSAWQAMSSGTTEFLWAVTGASDGTGGGLAVGLNGAVVTATANAGTASGFVARSASTGSALSTRASGRTTTGGRSTVAPRLAPHPATRAAGTPTLRTGAARRGPRR